MTNIQHSIQKNLLNSQHMSEKHPFQKAVEKRDLTALSTSLAEDIIYYTPLSVKPYKGREDAMKIFTLAARSFVFKDDFSYINFFRDGNTLLLMFRCRIGEYEADGVDYFELDKDDKISVVRVMMRPFPAIKELARIVAEIRAQV